MSTIIKAAIVVIVCTIVLSVISTVIPYWTVKDGLWTQGLDQRSTWIVADWLIAVRVLMITATVLLGISGVLAFVFYREQSVRSTANICIIALIVAGILLIAAVIVFAHNTPDMKYGAAFYLPVPTAVASLFTSLAVHRAKRPHPPEV